MGGGNEICTLGLNLGIQLGIIILKNIDLNDLKSYSDGGSVFCFKSVGPTNVCQHLWQYEPPQCEKNFVDHIQYFLPKTFMFR